MSTRVGTKGKGRTRNAIIDSSSIEDPRHAREDCSVCGHRDSVVWLRLGGTPGPWACVVCGAGRSLVDA